MVEHLVEQCMDNTESDSSYVDELVNGLVDKCCDRLDAYVAYVADILNKAGDTSEPITDQELDDIIMTLPTQMYFASESQEKLGIRHDVSSTNRQLLYNKLFSEADGTVGVRKAKAESELVNEDIALIVYERAYNQIKAKLAYALELLQSAKKVLGRRVAAMELSRSTVSRERS